MADSARLVIVDDQAETVELLRRVLVRGGYEHLVTSQRGDEVVGLCQAIAPDLLLLDLRMPGLDGLEVLELLRPLRAGVGRFPVLVLTGDSSVETRRAALAAGADDFLLKPFDQLEVLLRVRNLVETHRLQVALREDNDRLDAAVRERTRELELARAETLERLALATEFRDDDTNEHTRRIGRAAAAIARAMGLGEAVADTIERAAPLHDIGKLAISDTILLKPGSLTRDEYETMKTHALVGAEMLAGSRSAVLRMGEEIALTHHERWTGDGYPNGLAGDEIPLPGRIVAVADVFDALTHERTYKPAWPVAEALGELRSQRGRQFDAEVVDVFMELDHDALTAPLVVAA